MVWRRRRYGGWHSRIESLQVLSTLDLDLDLDCDNYSILKLELHTSFQRRMHTRKETKIENGKLIYFTLHMYMVIKIRLISVSLYH